MTEKNAKGDRVAVMSLCSLSSAQPQIVIIHIFQLSVSKVQKLVKLYTHAWLRIPYLWHVEVWLYAWSQVFAVQTECFWAFSFHCFVVIVCVFVCFSLYFFSLLFAVALVANKVINKLLAVNCPKSVYLNITFVHRERKLTPEKLAARAAVFTKDHWSSSLRQCYCRRRMIIVFLQLWYILRKNIIFNPNLWQVWYGRLNAAVPYSCVLSCDKSP